MKAEIRLTVEIPYLDKITRIMTALERYAPSGSILQVRINGKIVQKTQRDGNKWEAVR